MNFLYAASTALFTLLLLVHGVCGFLPAAMMGPTIGRSKLHPVHALVKNIANKLVPVSRCPKPCFIVTEFGAKSDGNTLNTKFIKAAFEAAKEAGGGTVYFPRGKFLTGPFDLVSYTRLVVEKGCTIEFISGPAGPKNLTPGETFNCCPSDKFSPPPDEQKATLTLVLFKDSCVFQTRLPFRNPSFCLADTGPSSLSTTYASGDPTLRPLRPQAVLRPPSPLLTPRVTLPFVP
ncbi:hypothetical protein CYMTET_10478 [Cymbomonas tetramitiformis]|uniref:Rhamnogalacturonase A/B/Epimerase-like pectate lyase domain-containing protein n=1 Tax=Cymbomonas tetramitiformis TaxID=36881 RepID=A0AAE0GP55_9CHLO|nr:hypothetical protein CYMTET_10478 [Cymbomonas tetramitiformis]